MSAPTNRGCLDQCELGPTVVVYPEAVWYGSVKPEDVDEIIESHIVGGQPVARLDHSRRHSEHHSQEITSKPPSDAL